ncbi:zinc finger MYND domain-containing protein 15-like [Chanos chanos]|uniref:Zinc finger MYND domain-containing protein 15-like n=1 Tax=Chanos chanos TaxID=29144 RepID=A0A6J2VSR5_CHACN|nr:zinc finger MYND domain-containing protein 15 [Chanos chanos]
MAQWYRCYQAVRSGRVERSGENEQSAQRYSKLPVDRKSPQWLLHLMDCTTPPPAAQTRLSQTGIDPSCLRKIWRAIVEIQVALRVNCDGESVLMVTDASGFLLGFDVLPRGWANSLELGEVAGGDSEGAVSITLRMLGLLRHSMETPMCGGSPRQPEMLRVSNKKLHRLLGRSERTLSVLNVNLAPEALGGWGPTEMDQETGAPKTIPFSLRWPPLRQCHMCKKYSFPCQLKPCPQCKAVLYCSDQCSQSDLSRCPEDSSHHYWCEKLALFMSHEPQLAALPFSYAKDSTAVDFDMEHFLEKNKLDSGYWRHWSLLVWSPRFELHHGMEHPRDPVPLWLSGHMEPYGSLKEEADILLVRIPHNSPSLSHPLVSWSQYCSWRGLSLSSPIAPLLSSPLSVYYIITSLVPRDFPELNVLKKQSLKIHIIESYREFHSLMVFWELSVLLPHVTFELLFSGDRFPPESDGQQLLLQRKNGQLTLVTPDLTSEERVNRRSIRIRVHSKPYHMLQGPKPDLVIGFRPAFPLHDSWLSTLPRLQSLRVPAYFCEPSELSCVSSLQVMNSATGGALTPPHMNPFRCPLRICGGDNLLPWFSNAFIFHLIYKSLVPCPQRFSVTSLQSCGQADQQQPATVRGSCTVPGPAPGKSQAQPEGEEAGLPGTHLVNANRHVTTHVFKEELNNPSHRRMTLS